MRLACGRASGAGSSAVAIPQLGSLPVCHADAPSASRDVPGSGSCWGEGHRSRSVRKGSGAGSHRARNQIPARGTSLGQPSPAAPAPGEAGDPGMRTGGTKSPFAGTDVPAGGWPEPPPRHSPAHAEGPGVTWVSPQCYPTAFPVTSPHHAKALAASVTASCPCRQRRRERRQGSSAACPASLPVPSPPAMDSRLPAWPGRGRRLGWGGQGWGLSGVVLVPGWKEKDRGAKPEQGDSGRASAERCGDAPPFQRRDGEGAEDKGVRREGAGSPAHPGLSHQVSPPPKEEMQPRKISRSKARL